MGHALARQSRSDATRAGVDVVHQAFPGVPVRRATAYRWAVDPWARGAFATFKPGQMSRIVPSIGTAIGRIHFAGEHTAPWMGWMEGALQSADTAVEEMLT
jgi:monoamine oxidase